MKIFPSIFMVLLLLPTMSWALDWEGVPTSALTDLLDETEGLPLLLKKDLALSSAITSTGHRGGFSTLVADLNGDGQDETVKATRSYIILRTMSPKGQILIQKQHNFPDEFTSVDGKKAGFTMNGPFDLDGDGNQEFMAWGSHPDMRTWGFWVFDGTEFQVESHFLLEGQRERKSDDIWDGAYAVIGAIEGLFPEQPRRLAVIICVNVSFDAYGRGMMAVDPYSGEIIWHYSCGPNPQPDRAQVVDLDSDGQAEIVFLGRSPDNLYGEKVGAYSDDQTRLIVLDPRGQEIWSQKLEGNLSTGELQIGDVDGLPGLEIVTLSRLVEKEEGHLRVFSGSGKMMAEANLNEVPISLALFPGAKQDDLLVSTKSGLLAKLRYRSGEIVPLRRAMFTFHLYIPLVFQDPISGSARIIVYENDHLTALLDSDFNPLAVNPEMGVPVVNQYQFYSSSGYTSIIRMGYGSPGFLVKKNPDALPSHALARFFVTMPRLGWALLFLLLTTLIGLWFLRKRHRQEIKARAVLPGDRNHLREARLHLLEDLELSGHGAIAPLRSLRRLIWLLDALKTGIEFNDDMSGRFREIWLDCHQEDIPRLLVILDRARAAQMNHPRIQSATNALQKIQGLLASFKDNSFAVQKLHQSREELHGHSNIAEAALQSLRKEVATLFKAEVRLVVERVMRANEDQIKKHGVKVEFGMAAAATAGSALENTPAQKLICRMDPNELEFIVDNLVGNAIRAMSGSSTRHLNISWIATTGMVKIEVRDTGLGIATEDLDRIMETPYSTRQGGGMGLPKSRRILRKYGGQLSIKSSSPGRGTTFQLLVPQA